MSGMTRDDVEHAFHVGIGDQGVEREVRGTEEAGRQLAEYARAIEHAGGGFIRVLRRWGVDPTWENALDTSYDGRRWHTDPSRSVGRPLRDDVVLGPSSDPALPRLVRHSVHREPARRPTGGASGDRFGARAVDHRGGVVWEKTGSSVKGLMDAADREVPKSKARSVVIREDYTSDGTYWGSGHGRVVASREGGGGRGPGGWIVEGYDVHHGAVNRAGRPRGSRVVDDRVVVAPRASVGDDWVARVSVGDWVEVEDRGGTIAGEVVHVGTSSSSLDPAGTRYARIRRSAGRSASEVDVAPPWQRLVHHEPGYRARADALRREGRKKRGDRAGVGRSRGGHVRVHDMTFAEFQAQAIQARQPRTSQQTVVVDVHAGNRAKTLTRKSPLVSTKDVDFGEYKLVYLGDPGRGMANKYDPVWGVVTYGGKVVRGPRPRDEVRQVIERATGKFEEDLPHPKDWILGKNEARGASSARFDPSPLTRVKVITSHAGKSRFLRETDDFPGATWVKGYVPRQKQIPSPYAYSPTDAVHAWQGRPIIIRETAHKRYEVFELPPDMPVEPNEDALVARMQREGAFR